MNDEPKRDWEKTWIHFVFGFVVGWLAVFSTGGGWIVNLAVALLLGILAAIYLDKFWEEFLSWW